MEVFNVLDAVNAPRFTATASRTAVEHTRILPMTQNANNIWYEVEF
jgi:hypothetical protein